MRRLYVALVVLGMLASGVWADGPVLRYIFTPGEVQQYVLTATGGGVMEITDRSRAQTPPALNVEMSLRGSIAMQTRSVDAEGNGELALAIGPMEIMTEAAGQVMRMELDVANGTVTVNGQAQALPTPIPGLADGRIGFRMSPRGETLSVEGLEALTAALQSVGWGAMDLGQMMKQMGPQLPEGPVSVGDAWRQSVDMELPGGSGKTVTFDTRYEVLSVDRVPGAVYLRMTGEFALPAALVVEAPVAAATAKVTVAELSERIVGDVLFDYKRGVMSRARMAVALNSLVQVEGSAPAEDGSTQAFAVATAMRDFGMSIYLALR